MKVFDTIIPICSICGSIRHNDGNWSSKDPARLELQDQRFSHGLCPRCVQEHYPHQYEAILKKQERQ